MTSDPEVERLTNVYREYNPMVAGRWDASNRGNQVILTELEREIARLTSRHEPSVRECRILDVGCGYGHFVDLFLRLGAQAENLHGIDLMPERIEAARARHPEVDFRVGNAEELPYPDGSFDLVLLLVVFTSILDTRMRANVAGEVRRVLAADGSILWYDFRYDNPRNPHVRGLGRADIGNIFPGFAGTIKTTTVLPPLARRLGPLTSTLYPLLKAIPILRTHNLALLRGRPPSERV